MWDLVSARSKNKIPQFGMTTIKKSNKVERMLKTNNYFSVDVCKYEDKCTDHIK